jgi:hypothetical protein
MTRRILFALSPAILLAAAFAATGQESPFKLEPAAPRVDEPFEVILVADAAAAPAGVRYDWFVHAKTAGTEVEPASAGVPDPAPNAPKLPIAKARVNTTYRITLSRVAGGTEVVLPTFIISFNDTMLVSAALAQPPAPAPAPMLPTPMPPVVPAPVVPAPGVPAPGVRPAAAIPPPPLPRDPSPNESVEQKLQSARIWAEGIAAAPKSDNLVLPVEYFQLALARPRANNVSLRTRTQTPLLDAELLYRAMHGAATSVPADATPQEAAAAWLAAKPRFLEAMDAYGQTDKTKLAWNEFVDEWQQEVTRVAPDRFQEALIQAGLIVTAVLLDYEKQHIEAAMTTGGPARRGGTMTTGGTYVGTGGYVPTHAAAHHERVMSRIYRRHDRRMARIRGY